MRWKPPLALPPQAGAFANAVPAAPVTALRHRLGSLLLQLERNEARIQELVRARRAA